MDPDNAVIIAVSVDMLDTGIDVPDVVNLVFYKPVFAKVKYHQMLGRGTRLRKDLFGPGQDKSEFLVFDLCGVLDFFGQAGTLKERETPLVAAPSTRLFRGQLELIRRLAARKPRTTGETALLERARDTLHGVVAGTNHENFFVRPHWTIVQGYAERSRWDRLDANDIHDLRDTLAELPSNARDEGSDARDFDIRCVALQLAVLERYPHAGRRGHWANPTVEMVEVVRTELRDFIRFIDHRKAAVI